MKSDRRQFLVQSTAAAGVTVAALNNAQLLRALEAPSQRLVVGVMGVNGRGTALARGFAQLPGCTVGYICDVDTRAVDKAVQALETLGKPRPKTVTDFRKILDDKDVDALVIAAPDHWHAPATILACKAGKHVYVEKPCCHNPREGELMVAAARKYRRVVQMGNQRRSWPKLREAMQALHEGVIGRVYYARCWYANVRGSIGRGRKVPVPSYLNYELWQGPAPRRPYRSNLIHYNWHWFWHWGTGELGNNGVHAIDLGRWGLGVDYPVQASAVGGRFHWNDDQETPDTLVATFRFPDGKSLTWEGLSCNRFGPDGSTFGATFHGEQGTLVLNERTRGYTIYDKGRRRVKVVSGQGTALDRDHLGNFLDGIRSGARLNSEIEEGFKSTLLCLLGNISYRTGRTVQLDPTTRQVENDPEQRQLWSREYAKGWEPTV